MAESQYRMPASSGLMAVADCVREHLEQEKGLAHGARGGCRCRTLHARAGILGVIEWPAAGESPLLPDAARRAHRALGSPQQRRAAVLEAPSPSRPGRAGFPDR